MGLKLLHKYANYQFSPLPEIQLLVVKEFKGTDLDDLCEAAVTTMHDSYGFSIGFNIAPPAINNLNLLENYFRGVLLVPERILIVGKIDNIIAGSIQLIKPSINNYATSFAGSIENHFVAPWARGHGLAQRLLAAAEEIALNLQLSIIKLSVNVSREAAIKLYESCGYKKWGTLQKYELIDNNFIAGNYYYKDLLNNC